MSEETVVTNQSDEIPVVERDAESEALFEQFGLPQQKKETKDVAFPKMDEPTDPPTIEEYEEFKEETKPESRKLTLKYNGEDKEVDEEEARTLAQKGLNYDKVQGKLTEQQKAMDELAQMQGYKDHAELLSNLPKLREQQQQKEANAHNEMLQELRAQAEDVGLDGDKLEAFLNNHPLVKEAEKLKQERDSERQARQAEEAKAAVSQKWDSMYSDPRVLAVFPTIVEDSQAFSRGETASFFTPEMRDRIERGYDPLDAIMLAHPEKFSAVTKKMTEQKLIQQQRLGNRAHVNEQTAATPDEGSLTPIQRSLAEEFGVDPKIVQNQQKIINSRR